MKCVKCGAELKQGCLYCSVCGHESQILPDYSVLEDDYLRSLLKEETKPKADWRKTLCGRAECKFLRLPNGNGGKRVGGGKL